MDRRVITVLGVSLLFALVVSAAFYRVAVRSGNVQRHATSDQEKIVIAARPLPVGIVIGPNDVKSVNVAVDQAPNGAFHHPEEVIGRPVISNILVDEPVVEGRLASRGSGQGLAPVIPLGMRAVSVRVNEVVGVAGYVLPGMRVDVLVTGSPPESRNAVTTTVLQNIQVISAGQNLQPDTRGQPVNAPVVILLVTPEQAEVLTLAGNEGHIQLVLRNGGDQKIEAPPGRDVAELYGRHAPPVPKVPASKPRRPSKPEPAPAAETAAEAPVDGIVVIRGTQKTIDSLEELP